MVRTTALIIAAFLSMASTKQSSWDAYQQMIAEHPELDEGLTKPVLDEAELWGELQFHLGYCLPHVKAGDLKFWRNWWDGTPLANMLIGQRVISIGDNQFYTGITEGRKDDVGAKACQSLLASWFDDMKATRLKSEESALSVTNAQ